MKVLSSTVFRHFSAISPFQRVGHAVNRLATSPTSSLYFRIIQCTFSTQDHPIVPKSKTRKSSPLKKKDSTTVTSSEETSYNVINTKTNTKSRKIPNNLLSNKVITALESYKRKYGNLLIPARFSIPTNDTDITTITSTNTIVNNNSNIISKKKKKRKGSNDTSPWPTDIAGLYLGRYVGTIRSSYRKNKLSKSAIARLDEMGFIWDVRRYQGQRILLALQTYKSLYGDLYVPKQFQCPAGDPRWPVEVGSLNLGYNLSNVRNRGDWSELLTPLKAMGVDFEPYKDHRSYEVTLNAALRFKELVGNMRVPKDFTIPSPLEENDNNNNSNSNNSSSNNSSSVDSGSSINGSSNSNKSSSKPSNHMLRLTRIEELQRPSSCHLWPSEFWGLKLGQKLNNIFYHDAYKDHRQLFMDAGIFEKNVRVRYAIDE